MSGRRIFINIGDKIRGIFDPQLCLDCGMTLPSGSGFCRSCQADFHYVSNPCRLCGLSNVSSGPVCPACLHRPPRWDHMLAPLVYTGSTRQLLQRLKYQQQSEVAAALAELLAGSFSQRPVQALLPVPMHYSRLIERGFNHADEIATQLARRLRIPVDRNLVQRRRATLPQSGLTPAQRQRNLQAAFTCTAQPAYRSVAIVDDIITSGSTMQVISQCLRRAGVDHIEVWSLARTLRD